MWIFVKLLTEQHFFEKVNQLAQCREEFSSQTQDYLKLKEEYAKLGKNGFIKLIWLSCFQL